MVQGTTIYLELRNMQITSSAIKLKDSDRMCQSQGNMKGDVVDATAYGLDA